MLALAAVTVRMLDVPASGANAVPDKRLRRDSFKNVPALIAAITKYIDAHNQNPQVFVWSASVEQIMTKIAKCKEA